MTRKHRIMLTICTVLLTLVLSLASCDKDSGTLADTKPNAPTATAPVKDTSDAEPDSQTEPTEVTSAFEPESQTEPTEGTSDMEQESQTEPVEGTSDAEPESQTQPAEETTEAEPETVHEHTYTDTITAPTCAEQGYTIHTCTVCGDSYTDSYTEATGHTPGAEADCTHDQTCTVCGVVMKAKTGHTYANEGVVTAPTCTEQGYTTHTCTVCGDSYRDNYTEATGHTSDAEADCTHDQICTVCGAVIHERLGHEYVAEVIEPTCTAQGYTTHTCSRCGDSYTSNYTDMAPDGHSFVEDFCEYCGCARYSCGLLYMLLDDGTYEVGWIGSCEDTNIIIPSVYNGKPVTSIGNGAFEDCTSLTNIIIPDSVTNIGWGAFYGCTSLTSIIIPDSVTFIGGEAFSICTGLTSVSIGNGVTYIDPYAFLNCTNLTSITLPDNIIFIGDSAFYNTGYYNDFSNWEDGVLYIGKHLIKAAVSGSYSIKEGTLTIADFAFYYCSSLMNITIPDSVISIGLEAFFCTGYYNDISNWEDGVLYIGKHLIKANVSGSYSIKEGTLTIASDAFHDCKYLTSVTIPNSLTSIGQGAFTRCTSLTEVYYDGTIVQWGEISTNTYLTFATIHCTDGDIN